jgi:hypothetical protein
VRLGTAGAKSGVGVSNSDATFAVSQVRARGTKLLRIGKRMGWREYEM